jgi:hypothetical protein
MPSRETAALWGLRRWFAVTTAKLWLWQNGLQDIQISSFGTATASSFGFFAKTNAADVACWHF